MMPMLRRLTAAFALHVLLLTLALAVPSAAAELRGPAGKPRARSLSPRLAAARDLGPAPSEAKTTVLVSLALRGRAALARFVEDVQDPTSPRYHRFLTQKHFVAHHAPTVRQEQAVVAYLQQQGFRITYRARNRLLVGGEGTVAATEQAFGVRLHDLVVGSETTRAALDEPSLPADLADHVVGVLGLGDAGGMKPHLRASETLDDAFGPPELARFYDNATGYDGRGETIAIGQSWVAASGDYGSRDCDDLPSVDFPASSPHVVAVGGTTPMCDAATCDHYGYETAWSGSGGGSSKFFARPAFQQGCGLPAGSRRLVPDVALASDPLPGILFRHAGEWRVTGGTSAAAPQWAGFLAQLNQRREIGRAHV